MSTTRPSARDDAPPCAPYETGKLKEFEGRIAEADEFFAGRGEVRNTLDRFAHRVEEAGIPYAVMGAMALNVHGHVRVTTDVDVVVSADARRRIHELLDGRGFLPPFEGSRNLRDTTNGVKIDLVLAGDFPGDGKEKPIAFPDPATEPVFIRDGVRYVTIEKLVELKLASGMTHRIRYRDLGDVASLIGSVRLPREFGERLHPWVRPKWFEIWDDWNNDPRKDDF
jgi:hypothetical protein